MIGDLDTVEMAKTYRANKAFFSTSAVTKDGVIACGSIYHKLHRVMIENSEQSIYLIDNEKLGHFPLKELCSFGEIDYVISDHDFSHLQSTFPNTVLITV